MMKILHTADWHLGQIFFGYERVEEHQAFLDWLSTQITESDIDALLIAGDVFDVANPSAQAQKQFYRFLKKVNTISPALQIVVIAGNHDSAARLEAPIPLLEEMNTHIKGVVRHNEEGEIELKDLIVELKDKHGIRQAWCMAIPYLRQGDYPVVRTENGDPYPAGVKSLYEAVYHEIIVHKKTNEAILAMGHLQASGAITSEGDNSERLIIGGLEGIPTDTFNPEITYTALGHIHREQRVGGRENIRYAGSPLPMSFAEENYKHGVILLEIQEGQLIHQEKIPFEPPVRLLRIPKQPKILSEVLRELEELPESNPLISAPFLEVRVLMTSPDPSMPYRVEETIHRKQVRLTRAIRVYPTENERPDTSQVLSTEELMNPWKMFQMVYRQKYNTDLPDELAELFMGAVQESHQKMGDKS